MRTIRKNTVEKIVSLAGVGLHSGDAVRINIHPVSQPCGVIFCRTDIHTGAVLNKNFWSTLEGDPETFSGSVVANANNVSSTQLGTTLSNEVGVKVATVEHLMAAFALTGIDNAIVDIDGPEVPILDGSADPFVAALLEAGVRPLREQQDPIIIKETIEVTDGDRFIQVEPCNRFELDVEISFDDPAIGRQSTHLAMANETCRDRLKLARTFCELRTVEAMHAAGLGRGGSLENAIVVDKGRMLNGVTLRDPQEFVLHKALDLIGDLALLERPIIGRVIAYKPGHDINNRFCRSLLEAITPSKKPEICQPSRVWNPIDDEQSQGAVA